MKRAFAVLLALSLLALSGLPLAQNKAVPNRVGFVDAETVVQAHPGYPAVAEIQKKRDAEMKPLIEKIKPLEAKIAAGEATAKERQDYQVLLEAIKKVQAKWNPKIQAKLEPLIKEVDRVVARVAKENGFAVVMNRRVAASSNLVVYADPSTDLTQAVVEALKKLQKQ